MPTLKRQLSFGFTILRELLGELYNLEDAKEDRIANPFNIFRATLRTTPKGKEFGPGMALLDEWSARHPTLAEKTDRYEIHPTAFFIDALTMEPHLTTVLWVKDERVYKGSVEAFSYNWEGLIKEFELSPSDAGLQGFLQGYLNTSAFLPAGAVAVAEGLKFFSDRVSDQALNQVPDSRPPG